MDKPVSAANANRYFSKLLRTVRKGRSYVVTSRGRPVAKLISLEEDDRIAPAARAALLKRLRGERIARVGRWTREELYRNEP